MTKPSLLGVWRLISIERGSNRVHTGQTHLVVREDLLWEAWPDSTYYEGEPGPERTYQLEWNGEDGRLEVLYPGRPSRCGLLRLTGNELRLRSGSVAGSFPRSFDDDAGTLAIFEREEDPATVKELLVPPPRVARQTRSHPSLGTLVFDDEEGRWTGTVSFCGVDEARFHLEGSEDLDDATLDHAATLVESVQCDDLKAYAASKLLEPQSAARLGPEDDRPDAASVEAGLIPGSVGVGAGGNVSVFFHDGDRFGGHVVVVTLDEKLTPVDAQIAG